MKENIIVPTESVTGDFISANCFTCHTEKKPDIIAHSTSNGPRAIRNAQEKVSKHKQDGHIIYFIVGRKPKA